MTHAVALESDADISRYADELNKLPVLARDQEKRLARRYRDDGDPAAAHELVVSNLRFVVKIAHEYRGYGMKLLDLIQEGNIGLMKAVKKFDPERGYRLISYAVWWIRAQIQSYILRSWSLVKLGTGHNSRKLFFKLRSEQYRAEQAAQGELSHSEIAERLDVNESDVDEMEVRLAARDFSLDTPRGEEGDLTPVQTVVDQSQPGQLEQVNKHEEKELVAEILDKADDSLKEKEKYILDNRLLAEDPLTLAEVGDRYGITRERARQIESDLYTKLRNVLPEVSGPAPAPTEAAP